MKKLLFKLLFRKEADKFIDYCLTREEQYKQNNKAGEHVAVSACRWRFIDIFIDNN